MAESILQPIRCTGGVKSISDDDLCSRCQSCQYRPGDMSSCDKGWPGMEDADGYVQECESLEEIASPDQNRAV